VNLRLMIWDILGQKEYSKIRDASMTGAHGIIIVGDLSRPETIKSMEEFWMEEAKKSVGKIPTIYVGNKSDLVPKDGPSAKLLTLISAKRAIDAFVCSAKTGENIEEVFMALGDKLITDIVDRKKLEGESLPSTLPEAVDFIIQDFCAQYGDLEKAMLIIQHQFAEARVDIRKPRKDAVLEALRLLMKAEELSLSQTVARVNYEERKRLIESIGK